jgi:hypothetical protein
MCEILSGQVLDLENNVAHGIVVNAKANGLLEMELVLAASDASIRQIGKLADRLSAARTGGG